MKRLIYIVAIFTFVTVAFTSCRNDKKTEKEELIEEMQEEGADVKVKEKGDKTKIKMETEEKEVKIKEKSDGDTKIKVDDNSTEQ